MSTHNGRVCEGGVCVVIPLFNGGPFIRETLQSVFAQTYEHFQVVVVDDASRDNGPSVVREFMGDDRVTLVLKEHTGIASGRNIGAKLADPSAPLICFLDQDDLWEPTFLEKTVRALEAAPEATGAFALAELVDSDGAPIDPGSYSTIMSRRLGLLDGDLRTVAPGAPLTVDQVFLSNPVYPPSCIVIRRAAFEEEAGFDPSYQVADDWDLVFRLARRGPIHQVPEVLAYYRRHSNNASNNKGRNIREARKVWARSYYSPENNTDTRALLRTCWRLEQRRKFNMKWASAAEILASGRLRPALTRALDALAHLMLPAPLPFWAGTAGRRGRKGRSIPITIEVHGSMTEAAVVLSAP